MTSILPVALAASWTAFALMGIRDQSFEVLRSQLARLLAASSAGLVLVWLTKGAHDSLTASAGVPWLENGFLGTAPIVISIVGLTAVGLADGISHSTSSLRSILLLVAIAMGFVAFEEPFVLASLWIASAVVAWNEIRRRRSAARLFFIYQGPSAVFLAAAVVAISLDEPLWATVLGLAAVGIREAAIPGHSWFLRYVEEAPLGVVVAFVGPQLGVYVHVQLLSGIVPQDYSNVVAGLGAATAIIGAWLGLSQPSMRRALAYLMMSQTGLVAFGLQTESEVASGGALLVWQVLALATSGFAMTLASLEARRGPIQLVEFDGCFARTPRMAAGFLLMGLASVGFPMTLGFVAEDLLVQGSALQRPVLAFVLIIATALNGMNVMRCFFILFSGRRESRGETDLVNREYLALSVILFALLLGGIAPGAIVAREFPSQQEPGAHTQKGLSRHESPNTRP